MGIGTTTASAILGAHKNQPIRGKLLVCGRQSMYFTPGEAAELLRAHGIEPRLAPSECEVDRETRLGGEGRPQRDGDGGAISDRSFFKMLGVDQTEFMDHSDYEGAETIVDLNYPIPDRLVGRLEGKYDFVIDGGTLDNVWNPCQALMNISRMLKPGGRLLTYNLYSLHYTPYTMLPQQWYLDYFALNRYAFGQVYFCLHESNGQKGVYQVNLAKRAAARGTEPQGNFPTTDPTVTIGTMVYAVKAADSTWEHQPSQECYRGGAEWEAVRPVLARFAAYPVQRPILTSSGLMPLNMPGGDEFQFVDPDGAVVSGEDREGYDAKVRANILETMKKLDAERGDRPWGICETERTFFQLVGTSAEARAIVTKPNVYLFDVRMLNDSTNIDGVVKEVYPVSAGLLLDIPLLVICEEPEVDVWWKRTSRVFRHLHLVAGCHSPPAGSDKPTKYFDCGIPMSPSLEHGAYHGLPLRYAGKIRDLLAAMNGQGGPASPAAPPEPAPATAPTARPRLRRRLRSAIARPWRALVGRG